MTWVLSGLLLCVVAWLLLIRDESRMLDSKSSAKEASDKAGGDGRPAADGTSQQDPRSEASKRAMEKYIEMGMAIPPDATNFSLVSPEGRVSPYALEQSGVGPNKLAGIQKVIDKLWEKMSRSMKDRMVKDPDKEGDCYLIPAAREKGDELLFRLEQDLGAIVGHASAKKLMSSLHATSHFGWFGKFDVELEILRSEKGIRIHYQTFDPDSGRKLRSGNTSFGSDGSNLLFGPEFKLD